MGTDPENVNPCWPTLLDSCLPRSTPESRIRPGAVGELHSSRCRRTALPSDGLHLMPAIPSGRPAPCRRRARPCRRARAKPSTRPAAGQQVNHEQQHDGVRRIGALRQVPEALPQALLQPQPGEKPLEDHQLGVRRAALRLERISSARFAFPRTAFPPSFTSAASFDVCSTASIVPRGPPLPGSAERFGIGFRKSEKRRRSGAA